MEVLGCSYALDRCLGLCCRLGGSKTSVGARASSRSTTRTANEPAVREFGDDTLRKIAVELTQSMRMSVTVDWARR